MGGSKDADIVKSYIFCGLPLKASENQPQRLDGWSAAVEAWLTEGDGSSGTGFSSAGDFLKALTEARGRLLGLLQLTTSTAAEVTAAQAKYLGLLVELSTVEQQATQAGDSDAVLHSTWFDAILPLAAFAPDGSSSTTTKWYATSGNRKQKQAAAAEAAAAAAATATPAPTSGFAYEAANTLLAVATWKMCKGAALVMAPGGAPPSGAMEAYQLYCQAAGVVDELRRKLLPQLGPHSAGSGDLSRELLTALHLFALAEAQSVMLQRAVALHYQGSTLASMATDTAMLFSQAYDALEGAVKTLGLPGWTFLPPMDTTTTTTTAASTATTSSGSSSSSSTTPAKNSRMAGFERIMGAELPQEWPMQALPLLQLAAYVQYQVGHCYCLASICAAELSLSSNQAGQAVALAQLGSNLCETLAELGFQQAGLIDPTSTLGARDSSRRLALQASLEAKAAHVLRRCLRENRTIYFQYVPAHPAALPWPARSAQPEIYRLPTPQGNLQDSTVQGLKAAAAVGSLSSFQASPAAAEAEAAPAQQQAAAAAAVVERSALDSRRGSSSVICPRLIDNTEPNSLAHLADETQAAVAAATAAAAACGYTVSTAAVDDGVQDGLLGSDQEAAAAAAAAEEKGGEQTDAAAHLSLQLDSSAAAVKSKMDVSADGGATSPVSSYTLPAGPADIGSSSSTDGSSDHDGCSSPLNHRRASASGSSTVSSRRSSSSSGGSSSWSEEAESEASLEDTSGGGGGLGGLLRGMFGCCIVPRDTWMSDDDADDAEGSESSEEEFEDAWETGSDASRASKQQQSWGSKQQKRAA